MRFGHVHAEGIVRREFLQVGFSGFLGMTVPGLLDAQARAAGAGAATTGASVGRAKSVILVFLTGGLSHIDSFDMKPDAPQGIRGEFKPVATSVPGLSICEHLPGLAARANRLAIVRSMSHGNANHLNATHQVLTGYPQPGAFFDKIASRTDVPCYAAALEYIRPTRDGVPSGVMLPTFLMEGPLVWPGQHAGFLGSRFDPWQIKQDPNQPGFREENLSLPIGFSVERLQERRGLLDRLGAQHDALAARSEGDPMDEKRALAYALLLSGKVARALEIGREDPRNRDRYGRHTYGQSLLLARRLVEAGVPIVQVNMGRVQTWDSHSRIFSTLSQRLLPPMDQGVSALLDDLSARSMLDETLVVVTGEFGRTPRIGSGNANTAPDGRDHWPRVFSAAFAGAGVVGGQVIGRPDKIGAYPASRPYSPADLAATIYRALGVDPATEIVDRLARPTRLCTGQEIAPLFSAATA